MDISTFLARFLPELPEEARTRLKAEYNLSDYLITVLTGDPPAIQLFDEAVRVARDNQNPTHHARIPEMVANFLCNDLFALVKESSYHAERNSIEDVTTSTTTIISTPATVTATATADDNSLRYSKVTGQQLGELVCLVLNGVISKTMAKQLLAILYNEEHGKSPQQVAMERGYQLITDRETLANLCREVIVANPEELERYKMGGKLARKLTKFFVGKAMAASHSNAHPERLHEILEEVLEEIAPGVEK